MGSQLRPDGGVIAVNNIGEAFSLSVVLLLIIKTYSIQDAVTSDAL